jgi:hypothetical protein
VISPPVRLLGATASFRLACAVFNQPNMLDVAITTAIKNAPVHEYCKNSLKTLLIMPLPRVILTARSHPGKRVAASCRIFGRRQNGGPVC